MKPSFNPPTISWLLRAAIVLTVACLTPSPARASDASWPQWRGPERDGAAPGEAWPDSLDESHLKELWRVPLGKSYSGPVVGGGVVFVTEDIEDKHEAALALDEKTGKPIWREQWDSELQVSAMGRIHGNWLKSTPAYDGERVYVAGMREVLRCFDAKTGKLLWTVDFPEKYATPIPSFGCSASPLVVGDAIYMNAAASFIKLDSRTGKELWRVLVRFDPKEVTTDPATAYAGESYASPVLVTIAGTPQILVQTLREVSAVDPETGKTLWTGMEDKKIGAGYLDPAAWGDQILISSPEYRTSLFKVSRKAEYFTVDSVWKNKVIAYMSSPIVVGDHAYMHLKNFRLASIDLKTGAENWITTERFGQYASFVNNGDKLLVLTGEGDLVLIRANPAKYEELSRRKVGEMSWGYLAVTGGKVFVRDVDAMAAYEWK